MNSITYLIFYFLTKELKMIPCRVPYFWCNLILMTSNLRLLGKKIQMREKTGKKNVVAGVALMINITRLANTK